MAQFDQVLSLSASGSPDEAPIYLEGLLRQDPEIPNHLYNLGQIDKG